MDGIFDKELLKTALKDLEHARGLLQDDPIAKLNVCGRDVVSIASQLVGEVAELSAMTKLCSQHPMMAPINGVRLLFTSPVLWNHWEHYFCYL